MHPDDGRKVNTAITGGNLRSSLLRLAMPMLAGALIQNLFNLVDLFFIGRLGHTAVAALAISGVVMAVLIMVAAGLSAGTLALIAHYTGKKDYYFADNVLFHTVILSIVLSVLMVGVGRFFTVPVLKLYGASPEVIGPASEYLEVLFTYSISVFLFFCFNQALRGSGDAMVPLKVLIFSLLVNVVLDPVLIFGLGFFPAMGIVGSAVATVISRGLGVVILLVHFFRKGGSLRFHRRVFRFNLPIMGRIIKIGFFSSFQIFLLQISFVFLIRFVTSFGVPALACYGIVQRLRMIVMAMGFGISGAAAVLIGQNMGAGQPDRATRAAWEAMKYYLMLVIPLGVVFFAFPYHVVSFFNDQAQVTKLGGVFLQFTASCFPFLAVGLVLSRSIQGAGDTAAPAVILGFALLVLRIPIAYILAFVLDIGINGIWIGICTSDIFNAVAMVLYFKSGLWKKRYHIHRAILEQGSLVQV